MENVCAPPALMAALSFAQPHINTVGQFHKIRQTLNLLFYLEIVDRLCLTDWSSIKINKCWWNIMWTNPSSIHSSIFLLLMILQCTSRLIHLYYTDQRTEACKTLGSSCSRVSLCLHKLEPWPLPAGSQPLSLTHQQTNLSTVTFQVWTRLNDLSAPATRDCFSSQSIREVYLNEASSATTWCFCFFMHTLLFLCMFHQHTLILKGFKY